MTIKNNDYLEALITIQDEDYLIEKFYTTSDEYNKRIKSVNSDEEKCYEKYYY